MSSWQPPPDLQGLGSSAQGPLPHLYVACALSSIPPHVRQQLEPLVEVVKDAIREATREAEQPWELSVYAPIEHSAPWNRPELAPQTVYAANAERLWTETDGLILFGHDGGSYGGGQEFAWAVAMRLPVLYINPLEPETGVSRLSRQVEGTPVDLTICAYRDPRDLREQLKSWIRSRRPVFEALAHHRADRPQVHEHLHAAVLQRWSDLTQRDRTRVIMECGLHPRRAEALLTDVNAFAAASLEEVAALANTLGLSLTVRGEQLPELTEPQRAALATAASECHWPPSRTLELERVARRELARGGVRRIVLTTPQSWIDLDQRHHG